MRRGQGSGRKVGGCREVTGGVVHGRHTCLETGWGEDREDVRVHHDVLEDGVADKKHAATDVT